MSEPAELTLTREQLEAALVDWKHNHSLADYESLELLAAAAERLLAQNPASDEEIRRALRQDEGDVCTWSVLSWRACERRLLLPFADEPAREDGGR